MSDKTRAELAERAARLLRNHVAGENVDDLMHYWADEWDAVTGEPYDTSERPEQEPQGAAPTFGRVRTPGDGPRCRCGKPAVWSGWCEMEDGRGYCSSR